MSEERRALCFVELDIQYCSLTYGVVPCTASVPTTGADKCVNTKCPAVDGGCQDRDHYTPSTVTLRFAMPAAYLPTDIDCIPCIMLEPEHTPGRVSLGEDLGERASLRVQLKDHPHSDAGEGFDKYFATRSYNPSKQGTLFGKFRVRQPFLRGQPLRWYQGFVGDALAEMEVRHFVVDSFDGPNEDGIFTIIAKDPLKLLDGDRALVPAMSSGFLAADVTNTASIAELLPTGVGNSEYDVTGHACIGGNEIVEYWRDAAASLDVNTLLYLQFNDADNATATTDSSPAALAVTRVGAAFVDADEHPFAFGGGSASHDGSGDGWSVPDAATWTFGGDFTIEAIVKPTTLGADRVIASHAASATVRYRLWVKSDGSLNFEILNTSTLLSLASAAGAIVTGTKYHVAVERFGNVWTLFKNGVVVAATTAAVSIPDFAAVFRVGLGQSNADGWFGNLTHVRVSGVARYAGAAFAPALGPYQASSDTMVLLTRGALGTEASSHQEEDRVQKVKIYNEQDVADIIYDLETTYGGIPAGYITLGDWQAETGAFLGQVYSPIYPEPIPVKQAVAELIKEAGLAHWHDDPAGKLRLLVIREVDSSAAVYDASKRLINSLRIEDQPGKRRSRVHVYYGMKDPTRGVTDPDNFRSMEPTIAEAAEEDYGNQVIETIYSRGIPEFGGGIAATLALNLLARFRDAPRKISWDVMRGGDIPQVGDGCKVTSPFLQDGYGRQVEVPVQVTRLTASRALVKVEAEEMRFASALSTDPNHHIVIISSNTTDFNLRARHDDLYGAPVAGNVITCIVNSGVIVSASDPAIYAFDTGDWTGTGVASITLLVNGTIQAAGGKGGKGAKIQSNSSAIVTSFTLAEPGGAGGTALKVRAAIDVDGVGAVKGGGGGGGGGGAGAYGSVNAKKYGGAAGGGAGRIVGVGAPVWDSHQDVGDDGTLTAGGLGKSGSGGGYSKPGGNGAAPGVAGQAGGNTDTATSYHIGGAAGAAGKSVEGNAFITEIGAVTFTGPRV